MKHKPGRYLMEIAQKQKQVQELNAMLNEETHTTDQQNQQLKVDGNHIYIYTDIDDKSLLFLKMSIQKLIYNYKQLQFVYPSIKDQDLSVDIHIASCGGDLFSGMCMYDILMDCQYRVNTYIEGYAASAATFLFLGGKYRYMTLNSFILIHQYSTAIEGTHKNLQDSFESGNKFMDKIKALYLSKLSITRQKLEQLLQSDLWLSYQQAKQIGFVNT